MDKIQELRDYIDELHIRIDYEDYVNLIDLVDKIDEKPYCKEDFRDCLIDNWVVVEDSINRNITTILCSEQGEFNKDGDVDRHVLSDYVSDNVKTCLLNIIEDLD